MESHASTAHMPSFSRTWSLPVPNDSSPHTLHLPASMRLPKNFQPVGVSKKGSFFLAATRSSAAAVGMERARPLMPLFFSHGMQRSPYAAMTATLSLGVTKNLGPRTMLRSPSPSEAAPKSAALGPFMNSTRSCAYVRFGSGWPPPKSSSGTPLTTLSGLAPSASTRIGLA